jgi:uncharacterized membrane protein SpoIIM required for sporulation
MDLNAFVAVHADEWARLDYLSKRRRLTGEQVDELVTLYQRAATHLSVIRSGNPDPVLVNRLSGTVATARSAVTGGHEPFWRELARMATVTFPLAVYRSARWSFASAVFTLAIATGMGFWAAGNPQVLSTAGSEDQLRQYAEVGFESYYSEYAASSFATWVWTNNAWISALCVIVGITGILVVLILLVNAVNLGMAAGVMATYDRLDLFFALILPHGLLELTAVFVAAGAGLNLFWSWVDPGPRSRGRSVAVEGRAMITEALGLVVVLAISGVIEAFVTPSPLPTWARISIGVIAWVSFLGYVVRFGRRAAVEGETADLRRELAGDVAPVTG